MIKGIAASNGIAIAKAYKLVMPDLTVEKVTVEDVEKEIAAYASAMEQTAKDLETIKETASKNLSAEEAAVFDAHALVLADPELKTQVEDKIRNEKCMHYLFIVFCFVFGATLGVWMTNLIIEKSILIFLLPMITTLCISVKTIDLIWKFIKMMASMLVEIIYVFKIQT